MSSREDIQRFTGESQQQPAAARHGSDSRPQNAAGVMADKKRVKMREAELLPCVVAGRWGRSLGLGGNINNNRSFFEQMSLIKRDAKTGGGRRHLGGQRQQRNHVAMAGDGNVEISPLRESIWEAVLISLGVENS
jgi:hypothetical protein